MLIHLPERVFIPLGRKVLTTFHKKTIPWGSGFVSLYLGHKNVLLVLLFLILITKCKLHLFTIRSQRLDFYSAQKLFCYLQKGPSETVGLNYRILF